MEGPWNNDQYTKRKEHRNKLHFLQTTFLHSLCLWLEMYLIIIIAVTAKNILFCNGLGSGSGQKF